MRVLLTNDDGIQADGLQALRRALIALPSVELVVIAPDGNRSAMARSITTRRPLWVQEVDFEDGTVGYATDGTPVDCVRLANLGLVEGFEAELVVAGINHGSNLGDDITYSGTVAAALEAIVLGLPGIAVSQQSVSRELDFRVGSGFDFEVAASFTARLVAELQNVPLPEGTLLNINVPGAQPDGRGGRAAGQADLPRRALAHRRGRHPPPRAPPVPDLRRRHLRARRDRAPISPPSPRARSPSRRSTSTSPTVTGSMRCSATTSPAWSPRPPRRWAASRLTLTAGDELTEPVTPAADEVSER